MWNQHQKKNNKHNINDNTTKSPKKKRKLLEKKYVCKYCKKRYSYKGIRINMKNINSSTELMNVLCILLLYYRFC